MTLLSSCRRAAETEIIRKVKAINGGEESDPAECVQTLERIRHTLSLAHGTGTDVAYRIAHAVIDHAMLRTYRQDIHSLIEAHPFESLDDETGKPFWCVLTTPTSHHCCWVESCQELPRLHLSSAPHLGVTAQVWDAEVSEAVGAERQRS